MNDHDELLKAAVDAHWEYLDTMREAKLRREGAFRKATQGAVKGREIAEKTGLSEAQVSRIARGKR